MVACEDPIAGATTKEDPLVELSRASGLTIIDVSVPFERFAEAPAKLRQMADTLNNGPSGLYVMRYYDDTLRHTNHIFIVSESGSRYIAISSLPGERNVRQEYQVIGAEYDDHTKAMTMQTNRGDIRLTSADVTSVGA